MVRTIDHPADGTCHVPWYVPWYAATKAKEAAQKQDIIRKEESQAKTQKHAEYQLAKKPKTVGLSINPALKRLRPSIDSSN